MSGLLPKHTVQRRDLLNYNGTVHNSAVFVRSGSIEGVTATITGSATLSFDAKALRIRRVEVFHSGTANSFTVTIENSSPNTGSFYDPRNIAVCYPDIPGSDDYSGGIDQVEDLFALTDGDDSSTGKLYLRIASNSTSLLDDFKYLMFFEAVFLYIDKDGNMNE